MADLLDNFSDLEELGIDLNEEVTLLSRIFDKAAQHLQTLLASVDTQTLLILYGLYKQGQEGPCNIAKPYWFDRKGKAKWEAWYKLGKMPQDEAKSMYIETIRSIDPSFEFDTNEQNVKVSSLLASEVVSCAEMTITDYIKEGNIEQVKQLLEKKKINDQDETGLGLLHWAADSGFLGIIKLLLDAGAKINLPDVDGQTALHYAASCGHIECLEFLLQNGANKNLLDTDGNRPIDVAANYVVEKLLS